MFLLRKHGDKSFRVSTLDIELNNKWRQFAEGKSVGQKGSENGTIVYDIEHIGGARVTLEQKTEIALYATTLGVYGLMFHTRFDSNKIDAKNFITQTIQKIDTLLEMLDIPKEKRDKAWKEKFNNLTQDLTEQ